MQKTVTTLSTLLLALFFLAALSRYRREKKAPAIGTFTGAGLGAIIGSATGNAGAAVGLIGGALIGDQMQARQKQEQDLQRQMAAQHAEIDRANREIQELKAQQAR